MAVTLSGKRIAFLVADGFEQIELTSPKVALEKAGATCQIISLRPGSVEGWHHFTKGDKFAVDGTVHRADPAAFDALVLPGGVANPDQLRVDNDALIFVRHFFDEHKPVAAICHGPWTLINADCVSGRRVTSYPSIRIDLVNAGANWVDEEVVSDAGLVTSRTPKDLPAFNKAVIEAIAASAVSSA